MSGRSERASRLYIWIFYEGPWEKVLNWAYGIDPDTDELRFEASPHAWHWRNLLARFADRRHHAWVRRYARRGRLPADRWRRPVRRAAESSHDTPKTFL